jgi:hypothetical protein
MALSFLFLGAHFRLKPMTTGYLGQAVYPIDLFRPPEIKNRGVISPERADCL